MCFLYNLGPRCRNFTIKDKHCDDNLEYLTMSCRPFYLPREFNCVYLTVAYVPPGGDKQAAAELLSNCVSNIDDKCPEGANVLLGDFNDCDIEDLIPNYNQFVLYHKRQQNIGFIVL